MKNMNTLSKFSLVLYMLLGIGTYVQAQSTERAVPPPAEESPKTIMLTEEEYLILKQKAENPSCPKVEQRIITRGDVRGKKGIVLRLGGGISYLYGADGNDANNTISSSYGNWYLEGMMGYTLNSDRQGLGTQFGVFANAGNLTQESVDRLLGDGQTGFTTDGQDRENRYYQGEAGFILFETIRLSTGFGMQEFVNNAGEDQQLNYYSTTAGIHFGARYFKVVVDVNMIYGRDVEERVYRPMIGIMFQL